jgi:hypothetical protein
LLLFRFAGKAELEMQGQSEPIILIIAPVKPRGVQIGASERFRKWLPFTPDRQSPGESQLNKKLQRGGLPRKPILFLGLV